MSDTSQGTGGVTFDQTKRSWPSEMNVLLALVIIIVVFEVLGQILPYMNDQSFLFDQMILVVSYGDSHLMHRFSSVAMSNK